MGLDKEHFFEIKVNKTVYLGYKKTIKPMTYGK